MRMRGTCLCKSVSVSFDLERKKFDACHCGMCRKWGGGPALTIDAGSGPIFEGEEFITRYQSSAWAERGFCGKCGTHLFYHLKEKDFYNLPLGLMSGTEDFTFGLEIFIDHKPSQYNFAEETKKMTQAEVFAKLM